MITLYHVTIPPGCDYTALAGLKAIAADLGGRYCSAISPAPKRGLGKIPSGFVFSSAENAMEFERRVTAEFVRPEKV